MFVMASSKEWPMTLVECQQEAYVLLLCVYFLHKIIKDNYNDFIVADNDMSVFVDGLICLIENESLRLAMEKQAIDYSNRFEVRILVEE